MTQRSEITATAVIAAVPLAFAHFILQPAPLPALSAVVGGLVARFLVRRGRARATTLGCLLGAVTGVAYHLYVHHVEGRTAEPAEGMIAHLLVDGLLGLGVAAAVLLIATTAFTAAARRAGR